jgi:AcrR family transcriptional regulator
MDSRESEVRLRILEMGRSYFFSRGLTKVTMDDLASRLGISKKTVYKHFPSKDSLANSILDWQVREVNAHVSEILSSREEYFTKLSRLWNYLARTYSQISEQCQDDVRRVRPDIWRRMEEFRRESITSHFGSLLDEGMKLGYLRKDLKKEILVRMYLSAIQGVINPEVLMQHSFSASEAFQSIMSVFFDGILSDQTRATYRRQFALYEPPARGL